MASLGAFVRDSAPYISTQAPVAAIRTITGRDPSVGPLLEQRGLAG